MLIRNKRRRKKYNCEKLKKASKSNIGKELRKERTRVTDEVDSL